VTSHSGYCIPFGLIERKRHHHVIHTSCIEGPVLYMSIMFKIPADDGLNIHVHTQTYDRCSRRARSSSSSTLAPPRHATLDTTPVRIRPGNHAVANCISYRTTARTNRLKERDCTKHELIVDLNQAGSQAATTTELLLQPCLGTRTAIRTAATVLPTVCVAMISTTAVATPVPTSAHDLEDRAGMEALEHRAPRPAFAAPAD
jgi:hypothetical protein